MGKMKTAPIIGITHSDSALRDQEMRVRTYCTRKYYQAVQAAGATVILLPPVPTLRELKIYISLIDGLVLPGGEDVDPRYQKEDPHPKLGTVNPLRDQFELEITQLAFSKKIPTLGICRGIQVIAIALGGSVYQDISEIAKIQHQQNAPRWATSHQVTLKTKSRMANFLKQTTFFTNSFHHQAIKKVPNELIAVGHTNDGIIEAVESKEDFPFYGVQWHPEETRHCDEISHKIFTEFIAQVIRHKKNK